MMMVLGMFVSMCALSNDNNIRRMISEETMRERRRGET